MPSKELFHIMIKTLSVICFLCVPIGFVLAEKENRRPELNQKASEVRERSMVAGCAVINIPKTSIVLQQYCKKKRLFLFNLLSISRLPHKSSLGRL